MSQSRECNRGKCVISLFDIKRSEVSRKSSRSKFDIIHIIIFTGARTHIMHTVEITSGLTSCIRKSFCTDLDIHCGDGDDEVSRRKFMT